MQEEENLNLSSLADAEQFLSQFEWLEEKLEKSISTLQVQTSEADDNLSPERVRAEVVTHWSEIMSHLQLEQQQDRLFQNKLTAALENVILSRVHDRVFQELCAKNQEKDLHILSHCQFLTQVNLPAEKLGIPEGYAVSFPAAVVELAALDLKKCPLDKLRCLRSTLDYIEAEIKQSIANAHIVSSAEALIPEISSQDMVPLLAAVLIQAKPLHLAANLHYVGSYQQTLSPYDPLCSSLETFQMALSHLLSTKVENDEELKSVRLGRGMSKELQIEELSQLTDYLNRINPEIKRETSPLPVTPLEYTMHQLAGNIERAMDDDDSEECDSY